MNELDPESQRIKDVYAYFGVVMYYAQCLERTTAISLATVYGPGPQKITRTQFDVLLESNFKKTLGKLIHELRNGSSISDDFESILSEALKKRNWLAHHYFWDRAQKFKTEEGQKDMKEELQEIADYFKEIDKNLTLILTNWGKKYGVTAEMIQQEFDILVNIEK
ncbi:MAG: hypothetical protein WA130_04225 [Candidatus Methanoperedens sp.]|nr:MAG: hypothetical protein OI719_00360 [Candidatus Methanoperedens sp.]